MKSREKQKRTRHKKIALPVSVTLHNGDKEMNFYASKKILQEASGLLSGLFERNKSATALKVKIPSMLHLVPLVSYLKTAEITRVKWSVKEFPVVWENFAFLQCKPGMEQMVKYFQETARSKDPEVLVTDSFIEKVKQEEFQRMMDFVSDEHLRLQYIAGNSFHPNKITKMIAKWNDQKPTKWGVKLLIRATVHSVGLPFKIDLRPVLSK